MFEPVHDGIILASLDRMYRMQYDSAAAQLATLPDGPARRYFTGLALVNRFNDLGDTAALFKAERLWQSIEDAAAPSGGTAPEASGRPDSNDALYRGLAELQLSYVADLTGGRIRSARLARKATGVLRPLSDRAEAEAALALYDYYKATLLKGVDWLPFVSADRDKPLRRLESAAPRSRYLRAVLQTSLLWLYYDAGRYDDGLNLIGEFLARYRGNRVYRAMRADFLFRRGESYLGDARASDLDSARAIQESLAAEYQGLKHVYPSGCLPIGYLCAVGNLAKIYAASPSSQKQTGLRQAQLTIWYSSQYAGVMDWIPSSLKREVKKLRDRK